MGAMDATWWGTGGRHVPLHFTPKGQNIFVSPPPQFVLSPHQTPGANFKHCRIRRNSLYIADVIHCTSPTKLREWHNSLYKADRRNSLYSAENSSKSQPDSWYTRKKRDFEKPTFVVSSYNSVCRELLRTFLPVRITVRAEISTVRKIFRFRQNSSKSQPDSGHKWNNVDFEKRRSRALKAVGTMIPTCPGHFVHKSEANCGGQRPTKKNIGQIWTSSGHC